MSERIINGTDRFRDRFSNSFVNDEILPEDNTGKVFSGQYIIFSNELKREGSK